MEEGLIIFMKNYTLEGKLTLSILIIIVKVFRSLNIKKFLTHHQPVDY